MLSENKLYENGLYINGEWIRDREKIPVKNPSNGDIVGEISKATTNDIKNAIDNSSEAFLHWKSLSAKKRGELILCYYDLIDSHRDELAQIMTVESGKTLTESYNEISYGIAYLSFYAAEGKRIYGSTIPANDVNKRAIVLKEPIGVCAAITPWNFPFAMVMRKVAPALAAGCSFIIKPSDQTPLTTLALGKLAEQAGLPAGVINILTGDSVLIGDALCSSDVVKKLTFTGSTEVGSILYKNCAPTIKKLSLELGGNSPFIVFKDADISNSVDGLINGKFRNSGQACVAPNRIFLEESIYDSFVEALTEKVKKIKVGDGFDPSSDIGPLINNKSKNKIKNLVTNAVANGAKLLCGGDIDPNLGGNFFMPTLLVDCNEHMDIFDEEIFGPVIAVYKFSTESEVISLSNKTKYGLASYFYTQNINRVFKVAEKLYFGIVGINTGLMNAENVPLGGLKMSGLGKEGSHYGMDDYISKKYLCIELN